MLCVCVSHHLLLVRRLIDWNCLILYVLHWYLAVFNMLNWHLTVFDVLLHWLLHTSLFPSHSMHWLQTLVVNFS